MTTVAERIPACVELTPGDEIQARQGGILFQGHVTHVQPAMELFWAQSRCGQRRIIEFNEYEVTLIEPAPRDLPADP